MRCELRLAHTILQHGSRNAEGSSKARIRNFFNSPLPIRSWGKLRYPVSGHSLLHIEDSRYPRFSIPSKFLVRSIFDSVMDLEAITWRIKVVHRSYNADVH